jgi:RNA polymerase subunit RPABC4/transcription elongation factor Spt4
MKCSNCGTEHEKDKCPKCSVNDILKMLVVGNDIIDDVEYQTWKRNLDERKKNKRERVYGR